MDLSDSVDSGAWLERALQGMDLGRKQLGCLDPTIGAACLVVVENPLQARNRRDLRTALRAGVIVDLPALAQS